MKKFILIILMAISCMISSTLITGCDKSDLGYKRSKKPIKPSEPAPTPTEPTPTTGTVAYLSLPASGAKNLSGQSNLVIEGLRFVDIPGNPLLLNGSSNIIIRNCFFDRASAEAISIENSSNITIESCLFNGVTTGVYVLSSKTIKIRNNQFVNVRMRSTGGRGQFVQFNNVSGEGNLIENNQGENFAGESDPEDLISLFSSSGTAASPISIRNNMFRGGGLSTSGGGIMLGDYGGSYQVASNNTVLNPGQYGMAASGGNYIQILDNKIYSIKTTVSNNPLYVANYSNTTCGDITVRGNRVNWTDKNGGINMGWNSGDCTNTVYEPNTTISLAELGVPDHLITMITPEELIQIRQ